MTIERDDLNPGELLPSGADQLAGRFRLPSRGHCAVCGEIVEYDTDRSGRLVLVDLDGATVHEHQEIRLRRAELQVCDPEDGHWTSVGTVEGDDLEAAARGAGYSWAVEVDVSYRFIPTEKEPPRPENAWVAYYRMYPIGHPNDDALSLGRQMRDVERAVGKLGPIVGSLVEIETRTGRSRLSTALAWCAFYDAKLVIGTMGGDLEEDPEFRTLLRGRDLHIRVADDPDWYLDRGLPLMAGS